MQRAASRLLGGLGVGTSTQRAASVLAPVQGLRYQLGQRGLSASPQALATSDEAGDGNVVAPAEGAPKRKGLLKSILHGSEKAKAEQPVTQADAAQTGQHSHLVGRGKYIHELHCHQVKPGKVAEYKKIVEEYYTQLASADSTSKLTGSWEVVVGDLDNFYHMVMPSLAESEEQAPDLQTQWEHDGMQAMDNIMPRLAAAPEYQDYRDRLLPLLRERRSQLIQEFSFWPSSPPQERGGIYELRTYDLRPGTLLEWENEWRVGLEARKKFVQPIGAWFAQVGQLHQVLHMWHYNSLEERKQMRQRAWEIDTWSRTVAKTVKLANNMSAQILKPLPFSPLR